MSSRRRLTDDGQLEAIYARVPDANCKGLCEYSCGSVGMTPMEQQRIATRHGIALPLMGSHAHTEVRVSPLGVQTPGRCAALGDDSRCKVYRDRPLVCRLWASVKQMACIFGCEPEGGFMDPGDASAAMREAQELSDRVCSEPPTRRAPPARRRRR